MYLKPKWTRLLLLLIGGAILLSFLITILTAPQPADSQTGPDLSVTGAASLTYPGSQTRYHLELLNHTDQIIYDGVITLTLPISFTYVPSSTIVMGEGWPLESHEPIINGQTLTWGPYPLPAAGNRAHNPYGIHTMMHSCAEMALQLEGAKNLVGNGGYVTQLFYGIDSNTTGPSQCAVNFVSEAYARNLIPIIRLQGHFVNGLWQAPQPGPNGDYGPVAQGFANFVAGLPRRDTNPLYIAVWNEPNLWIEWSGSPNATQYARFFVAVSNAIRHLGDARIRLVNGGLTAGHTGFVDQMLRVPGFRDAFDAWASHCYPYNHPDWYNNHLGTARYGSYAIDCYLEELAVIRRYGRTGVKVILTETGYNLGNNTFDFEGFAPINETNRAAYIAGAFANYWQKWPEVIAVTPFELADSSGHWSKFDWVYPTPPYAKHPQYNAVAALAKPEAGLEPYGYQVTFKAQLSPYIGPGTYNGHLSGSDQEGHTATGTATVQVVETDAFRTIYLPLIWAPPRREGPWYLSRAEPPSPGAIVPTHFLKPSGQTEISATAAVETLSLSGTGRPVAMALAQPAGLAGILLADGHLEIIDLSNNQSKGTLLVGTRPQTLTPHAPGSAGVYVALVDSLALVDLEAAQVVARRAETGRWRGLAWDESTHRLFVADAARERLVILRDDLSQLVTTVSLDQQPDHLIFDPKARRLYLSFPALSQVVVLDADSLVVIAQATLPGGPLLDLAWDGARQRLYALSALAPTYRGLTVWQTPALDQLALVAGGGNFPLRTASALGLSPTGQLLVPETTGLWQISPDAFRVNNIYPTSTLQTVGQIEVDQSNGTFYLLESSSQPKLKAVRISR